MKMPTINWWDRLNDRVPDLSDIKLWLGDAGVMVKLAILTVFLVIAGYTSLFVWQYEIEDELDIAPNPKFVVQGGSQTIAMLATVIDRQSQETTWAPNKGALFYIYPVAFSNNMTSYQMGVHHAVANVALGVHKLLGKDQGSSAEDEMLTKAVGRFNTDPTEWNVAKTAPGEYQTGIAYIMDFNRRVGTGQAKITDDAKSLASFLRDYVSNDLGGASAILEPIILQPSDVTENARTFMSPEAKRRLSSNWGYFDTNATEPFFLTKGKLYAYYNILMAVGTDYEARLKERGAWDNWQNMLMSLRVGASMDRFFVANGEKDDTFTPQHVAVMGFSLLRADKQIREIAAIMEK